MKEKLQKPWLASALGAIAISAELPGWLSLQPLHHGPRQESEQEREQTLCISHRRVTGISGRYAPLSTLEFKSPRQIFHRRGDVVEEMNGNRDEWF
jgi:hypothetical protein